MPTPKQAPKKKPSVATKKLLESAQETLQSLPAEQLKVAAEFLNFLNERGSDEATAELLRIPGIMEDLAEAEREFASGGGTPWREVRQDV